MLDFDLYSSMRAVNLISESFLSTEICPTDSSSMGINLQSDTKTEKSTHGNPRHEPVNMENYSIIARAIRHGSNNTHTDN